MDKEQGEDEGEQGRGYGPSLFLQDGVNLENQNWQLALKYIPHGAVIHSSRYW